MSEYDYVIVGAGSAGCALANRLTADGRATVLVLEAGGTDRRFWLQTPIGYGKVFHDPSVNWRYMSEPEPGLGGERSYWPRGKVLGGSSSINAMVYVRGHPSDYDDWDAPGWTWADVAPVFRRMEDFSGGADAHRGAGGPLSVQTIERDAHPICDAYLTAAGEAGIPLNPDYNGASMIGAALYQLTTEGGLRASSARSYLRPAMRRPNLRVETRAHVRRVLLKDGRATGVAYRRHGREETARARRGVILSAGAVNTPQILMLSGVGAGAMLREYGIDVAVDAPMVGRNLMDHLGLDIICRANRPTLNQALGPLLGKLSAGLRFLALRRGPLSLSVNQGGGFVRTASGEGRPDTQLYFSPLSYTKAPPGVRPLLRPDPFPGFSLGFNPCLPTSRGSIALGSADPFAPPVIRPNYLDTEHDRALMRAGLRLLRRLIETPAMQATIDAVLSPEALSDDDAVLDAFARDNAWSVFHASGTCRMGRDPAASVVDERLRVRGVAGLRVVDASIFPTIPTGNTNAPAIMVGERGADLILEDETP